MGLGQRGGAPAAPRPRPSCRRPRGPRSAVALAGGPGRHVVGDRHRVQVTGDITRSERPRSVRATTTLPSRITSRWPYGRSAASTASAIARSSPLTDAMSIRARSSVDGSPARSSRSVGARRHRFGLRRDGSLPTPGSARRMTSPPPAPTRSACGWGLAAVHGPPASSTPTSPDPGWAPPDRTPRRPSSPSAVGEDELRRGPDRAVRSASTWTRRRPTPPTPTCGCTCSATGWSSPARINLDGIFGVLPNVVWTSAGPCAGGRLRGRPDPAPGPARAGDRVRGRQVPPDGRLRAAHGRPDRRCGPGPARRAPGRGHHRDARGLRQLQRRHAGHVDGRGPDLGRGASSAGTPTSAAAPRSWAPCPAAASSQISVGERCLLGANAGIGISLGDDCVVEAGLYVTAATKVSLPGGRWSRPRSCRDRAGCCSSATRSAARSRSVAATGRRRRAEPGPAPELS